MSTNPYPRGSEWRKWDLHVHTPKSINQEYGGDNPEAWEKFIADLESLPSDFKVIGINDYIFIDGYKEVLKYKAKGRLVNIDLILPVIELRIDKFASLGDEAWKKVNLHVIFSTEHAPEVIEAQFLSAIQHTIKIAPDVEDVTFKGVATREALENIGKQIKNSSTTPINESDLKAGFSNVTFGYEQVMDLCEGYFKGSCLTTIGKSEWDTMRWTGSAAQKKTVINRANFTFTSLEKAELHAKHIKSLEAQGVRSVLLDCSDAHTFSNSTNKDRIGNCFTWLKADPTFEGLKQVANDRDRIFVGGTPPLLTRVEANKTKFIDTLKISKNNPSFSEKWFDGFELPLNYSMVAIIGNKGNGKSAVADALGLVGNTPNYGYFSFLTNNKFRNKKPINKSENFEASITWKDGTTDLMRLSQNPDKSSVEKIKYIPQGFLERLCNKNVDEQDMFEPELRKVIFSHISETNRLGKTTLNELIDYKTEITDTEINSIKQEIFVTNKLIVELERKQGADYRNSIEQKLKEKEAELKAHEGIKPIPVDPPTDPKVIEQSKTVSDEIAIHRIKLNEVETSINQKQSKLTSLRQETSELDKSDQLLAAFESQFKKLQNDLSDSLSKYQLAFNEIVTVKIDRTTLQKRIGTTLNSIKLIELELGTSAKQEGGLFLDQRNLVTKIKDLQNKLDQHSKNYQKFLDDEKSWKEKKSSLLGSPNKIETIEYYRAQIKYLVENLGPDLEVQYNKRTDVIKKLFLKKNEILSLYKSLFKPVSDFIVAYGQTLEDYTINLDVDYKIEGFAEKFFDHVSLGAKGSFIGNPNGLEKLTQILETHDLKTEVGLLGFLTDIIHHLKFDSRDENKQIREIDKQLKKGYTVLDLYTFLCDLDYLIPEYKLKLGDKTVSELSPGERGALLLIFYLTLDQDDIPLVIDQPEENLDNQSIFKILVQFIKNAKNKRQIIIVTHNPNLAVASNAEQVVHVSIEKKNGNKLNYITGALENTTINNAVIDILEGTYPALTTRTDTYKIIKR